jgi:hypothetical protein
LGGVRASALQTILRVFVGSRVDLFVYAKGLLSTIGCLEGHSVKPGEVAAMKKVCRVRGWEIPLEFSLNPPNSPAVLMHWRAIIELLELMSTPMGDGLCSLRFLLAGSRGFGNSGEPPAVRPKVDRPEEPMDWTHDTLTTSSISLILYLSKFLVHIYNPDVHVITGGLNIITNLSLGEVFAKGPNFHEPKSINWTNNSKILLDSVEDNGLNVRKRTYILFLRPVKLLQLFDCQIIQSLLCIKRTKLSNM